MNSENKNAFKNWINKDLVHRIAMHLGFHNPQFNSKKFIAIEKELHRFELKGRVHLIRDGLHQNLACSYPKALDLLLKAVTNPHPQYKPLMGFDLWPFMEYIQKYGIDDFKESLKALYLLTPKFTAEFAIRPFLIQRPKETLCVLEKWAHDENHHVRRLVSEASRPRLPWGEVLREFVEDPRPTLKLLDILKYDDELYVRKSVANHLNDITKTHPKLVLRTLKQWDRKSPKIHQAKIQWITRHSLRTLVKAGDLEALSLLGFDTKAKVQFKDFKLKSYSIQPGNYLEFEFTVQSTKKASVVIDYAIHYKKANGSNSPKVFKLSNKELLPKKEVAMTKKHSFKPVTTRKLYPGVHFLEILINGKSMGKIKFNLT